MEKVTILVNDSLEGLKLQEQIIELINNSEVGKSAIVLPGIIKHPK